MVVGDLPNDFLSLDPQPGQGQGIAPRPPNLINPLVDGSPAPSAVGPDLASASRSAPVRVLLLVAYTNITAINYFTLTIT